MAKQRITTKSFFYYRYAQKPLSAPPHVWEFASDDETKQIPLDEQIEGYLERTGLELVDASAPSTSAMFLDTEQRVQQIIFATTIKCKLP